MVFDLPRCAGTLSQPPQRQPLCLDVLSPQPPPEMQLSFRDLPQVMKSLVGSLTSEPNSSFF